MRRHSAAMAAACCLIAAPAARGATFTVAGTADGFGSAACSGAACPSLRAAVSAANAAPGSTITLGAGTYTLDLAHGGQLVITAPMLIRGAGPGGTGGTVIEQTGMNRVIHVAAFPDPAGVALSQLEVTGGNAGGAPILGGGIWSEHKLALDHVLITHNTLRGTAGTAGVTGSLGGDAVGGGLALDTGATGSVIDASTITANTVLAGSGGMGSAGKGGDGGEAKGGGIANLAGPTTSSGTTVTIADSTISANTATGGDAGAGPQAGAFGGVSLGGGMLDYGGQSLISGTIISGNTAVGGFPTIADGGGIYDGSARGSTIVDSTVFGNVARADADYGRGGGVDGSSAGRTMLASDTIVANTAGGAFGYGGNIEGRYAISDSIVAGGTVPSNVVSEGSDCDPSAVDPPVDGGHNLEDSATDQCGFSAVQHDVIAVDPKLASAPADNGGPTETLAPLTGSPVLGAGGQCSDPTSTPPGAPLATDQRGEPRHGPCDIGAFEHQPPVSTAAPAITGTPGQGKALACAQGTWTGDGLSFSSGWLRDGSAIPGATATTYTVVAADIGHQLACEVTATGTYGSQTATSPAVTAVAPAPVVSGVRQSHKVWRGGSARARVTRRHGHATGTTFRFRLNAPATVTLAFTAARGGRKAGTLTFGNLNAGAHTVRFDGRLSRRRRLRLGSYKLVITAANGSGRASSRALRFTIVSR